MFTKLSLTNFKSFVSTGTISLAPLTIFSGQNSSGKSTLIQSLLLLKQSLESPVADEPVPLNGLYISLGGFSDVINVSAKAQKEIGIEFELDFPDSLKLELESNASFYRTNLDKINIGIFFGHPKNQIPRLLRLVVSGTCEEVTFSATIKSNNKCLSKLERRFDIGNSNIPNKRTLFEVTQSDGFRILPQAIIFNSFLPELILMPVNKKLNEKQEEFLKELIDKLSSELSISLPNYAKDRIWRESLKYIKENFKKRSNLTTTQRKDSVRNTLRCINKILIDRENNLIDRNNLESILTKLNSPVLLEVEALAEKWLKEITSVMNIKKVLMPEHIRNFTLDYLDFEDIDYLVKKTFEKMYYLGPLRDEPRTFYRQLASKDPMYVGQKGENLAFVLKYYSDKEIRAIVPPEVDQDWNPFASEIMTMTLGEAVNRWIRYLGVAKKVRIDKIGDVGLTIRTNIFDNADSSLTNVGVGVSQVLPLIVLGLASPDNSILILEQPELHLHPYIQSRLGDFLISLVHMGKQVIAETHSEHLILRTRYHIAKANVSVEKDVSVNFCELSNEMDQSIVSKVKIDKYGSIADWPKGFFDETKKLLEEIVMAAFEREDI